VPKVRVGVRVHLPLDELVGVEVAREAGESDAHVRRRAHLEAEVRAARALARLVAERVRRCRPR
jgi:hypothetical protein